ncbi:EAL domain-containing protein [Thiohalocapsa sp.]|uniref:EAL domain-containing protein n=1 Tax=Thiohalocapsa sp. TaxID=2497641 RepID=UPI0025DBF307|nr:EAL domain-containing protein [Thiohalocapsa sp.]
MELQLEDAGLGLWAWEPKSDRLQLSPRWAASCGLAADGASLPMTWWRDQIHPDDRIRWRAALDAQLRERGPGYRLEYRLRGSGGHWRWVQERGTHDGGGLAGVHLDVTPLKRAEADLKDSYELFAAVFGATRDGVVVLEPADLRIVSFNDAACAMLGYDREAFGALRLSDLMVAAARSDLASRIQQLLQQRGGSAGLHLRRADGSPLALSARFRVVQRAGRAQLAAVWSGADVQTRQALADTNGRLAALFDNPVFGVAELSLDQHLMRINPVLADLLERAPDSLRGLKLTHLVHPRDQGSDRTQIGQLLAGEIDRYRCRKHLLAANGAARATDWTLSLLRGAGGKPAGFSAVVEDIRPRQLLRRRAAEARAVSERLLELVDDAVVLCRRVAADEGAPEFEIAAVNPPAQRLLGRAEPELVGRRLLVALPTLGDGELPAALWRLDHRRTERVVVTLPPPRAEAASGDALGDTAGGARCPVTLGATEAGELLLVLHPEADAAASPPPSQPGQVERDALTGLPGLGLFQDRIDQAIAAADAATDAAGASAPASTRASVRASEARALAVCCLDLDDFKGVNEVHGRDIGDALLKQLAERLAGQLPPTDTLARWGGDDFGLLLTDIDSVEGCAERLQAVLDTVAAPFRIGPRTVEITASIGVALYPRDREQAAGLLRHATHALLLSKARAPGSFQFLDVEADGLAVAHRDHLEQVEQSLALDQLDLHLQPIVDLARGVPVAAEALLRWPHPQRGLLGAGSVLPDRAGAHLLRRLDVWVLDHALPELQRWVEQGIGLRLHVNISAQTLIHGGFVEVLRMLLDAYPLVPPERLVIEVQESAAAADLAAVADSIREGRALGVGFALDDFGTGASSMTYFRGLPAQLLKIDQSFVRDMLDDREAGSIVTAIVGLAQAFNRTPIAEGVEHAAQATALGRIGCPLVQGFGIAEPMPGLDLLDWLVRWRLPADWVAVTAD